MGFQKGNTYGNRKGRPRKGDSLAECVRARFDRKRRNQVIDAIIQKAAGGNDKAYLALARTGWPDEVRGELVLTTDPQRPPVILHQHLDAD